VLEACEAIADAHALGIVHRDLKPSNLFLAARRDGSTVVKVLDFGISRWTRALENATGAALSLTEHAATLGSTQYMSPEQLRNAKQVDARTDIWALGVVLFELLSGAPPFEGKSAAAVGANIAAAEPKRLRELVPGVPDGLEAIVRRCLEKDPD